MADGPGSVSIGTSFSPLDPLGLVGGLTYIGVVTGQLVLDRLTGPPLAGPWALAGAGLCGLTTGVLAAVLFTRRLERADIPGGGRAIVVVAIAVTIAAAVHPQQLPPAAFWDAAAAATPRRWWWLALMAAAPLPALIPSLSLAAGETLHEARLRRASAAWFCVGGPPAVATIAALACGGDPVLWLAALAGPQLLVLGALSVRIPEDAMHRRGTRVRLAAVSWAGTTLLLVLGWLREMAG